MSGVNWGLGIMPDIGGNALAAFERGQEQGRQRKAQEAMATYATNPEDPNALNALAQFDPKFVMGQKQAMAKQQQDAAEKQRGDLLTMGKLLSHAKDPASYAQARQAAQMYGMDVSQIPEQYDPEYIGRTSILVNTLIDKGPESVSSFGKIAADEGLQPGTPEFAKRVTDLVVADHYKTVPYTQGGGVAGVNTLTGQTRTVIAPNPGDKPTGAPVGAGPQPGSVVGGFRFKGGNPNDRSSWEPATGGAGSNASGGFRPVGLSGERVTSTTRSPAHNKAVGGVGNSYHLSGRARDSVPPAGMTMAAYASELRRLNPGLDVINEGDHIHMEPR